MTNETEQLRPELGYFDDPLQTKPKYDPPVNLPCPYCKEPMHHFDVRTIGFMNAKHRTRSWFYRVHKSCDEKKTQEQRDALFYMMTQKSEASND